MKNAEPKQNICFAEFELDAAHRRLMCFGETVTLNAKAFDLLVFLTENAGRIVTKDEILEKVWEGQFVEEANLTVQISALRRALGEKKDAPRFLVTIPGKGYEFVADVTGNQSEIIVEKHKFSRLIVKEENEIEIPKSEIANPKSQIESPVLTNNGKKQSLILFVILILSGLILGFYQYLRAKKIHPPFEKIKITRLTNNGKIEAAAASPDGKFIAYVLGEAEGNSLWVRQIEAANDTRIVPPLKGNFWELTFTPDSKQIYYDIFVGDKADPELFRIPTLGGVSQKVLNIEPFTISFAPDGKRFAHIISDSKNSSNYLGISNADGTNKQIIAKKPYPNSFVFEGNFTAWSPDGETIACLVNYLEAGSNYSSIIGVSVKDGSEKPLGNRQWQDVRGFEWLKDGSGLLVSGGEKNSAKNQIWFLSLPDGEVRPVTDDLNNYSWLSLNANGDSLIALETAAVNGIYVGETGSEENKFKEIASEVSPLNPFVWTPDGKIIFRSSSDAVPNLWIMEADGTNRRQLTANAQVDERGICLTPDGKYIVFTSWRSGKSNLWRVDADGKNLFQLTNGEADVDPDCTPDGQSVIFQRGILTQPRLWKVSINGGESVRLTDFWSKWGEISTDGKKLSFFQLNDDRWRIGIIEAEGGQILQRLDVPQMLLDKRIQWSFDNRSLFYIGTIGNIGNIWSLPLDGSSPKQITNFSSRRLSDFSWSPDRKKLAVARSLSINDIVLITNSN